MAYGRYEQPQIPNAVLAQFLSNTNESPIDVYKKAAQSRAEIADTRDKLRARNQQRELANSLTEANPQTIEEILPLLQKHYVSTGDAPNLLNLGQVGTQMQTNKLSLEEKQAASNQRKLIEEQFKTLNPTDLQSIQRIFSGAGDYSSASNILGKIVDDQRANEQLGISRANLGLSQRSSDRADQELELSREGKALDIQTKEIAIEEAKRDTEGKLNYENAVRNATPEQLGDPLWHAQAMATAGYTKGLETMQGRIQQGVLAETKAKIDAEQRATTNELAQKRLQLSINADERAWAEEKRKQFDTEATKNINTLQGIYEEQKKRGDLNGMAKTLAKIKQLEAVEQYSLEGITNQTGGGQSSSASDSLVGKTLDMSKAIPIN